jgi:DNA-binding NarL/FixJ family response regulator
MTNRDVAAKLLVSPKTVEAKRARIYRKLDIRSRAQLGSYMRSATDRETPDLSGNSAT